MTIYNKYLDQVTLTDKWQKHVVHEVLWDGMSAGKALNGIMQTNTCKVYIPYNANYFTEYLSPIDFLADPTDHWTINIGDIIVKGTVNDDINKMSDLKTLYTDVYTVNFWKDNRYGSPPMWHFELGGF